MKSYNGFPPQQRVRALAWINKQYAAGTIQRATVCDACDQAEGILDRHSEDYSEPFGPHIGAYQFCFTCHMMIHCRFASPEAWAKYREAIRKGATFPPLHTRNFYVISNWYLKSNFPEPRWREPPDRLVLDEIHNRAMVPAPA